MATFERIDQELKNAGVRLDEATKNLRTFEEGEDDGKWLKKLSRKLDEEEWENERQKGRWEEMVKKLEEEKERLVKSKVQWENEVVEWGRKLCEFEEKGNEQIV